MSEPTAPNPSVEALQLSKEDEEEARRLMGDNFLALTSDEQKCLSTVLFPETDLDFVEIGGKKRPIHPLPLKLSKQVYALLEPFAKAHREAEASSEKVSLNEDIVAALLEFGKCLAEYYKWDDVIELIKTEMIVLPELQSLAVKQQQKSGVNDFLLASLRTLVNVMRLYEITNVKFANMFTTLPFRKSATVASTSLSADIPAGSSL